MTIKEFSVEAVSKSVREMTEEATRVALEAFEIAIEDVNRAAATAHEEAQQATRRVEEINVSIKIVAEEATRAAREASNAAIREVNNSVEAAHLLSRETASQAERVIQSAREWAEETTRSAQEAAEKLVKDASKSLAMAEEASKQAVRRTEEFSDSAKRMAEEAARSAREASEMTIKEAHGAAAIIEEALQRAANRAEEISNLAEDLAEQATRSAMEAAEVAKRAFDESMARSIDRAEKAARYQHVKEGERGETKKVVESQKSETTILRTEVPVDNGQNGKIAELQIQEQALESSPTTPAPEIALSSDSLVSPVMRIIETGEEKGQQVREPVETVPEEAGPAKVVANVEERQQANEVKKVIGAEENARKQADIEDVGQARNKDGRLQVHQGTVQLVIPRGGLIELKDFEDQLRRLDNIKVLWTGGSQEGSKIAISLEQPVALLETLSYLPMVKCAADDGGKVCVTLKNWTHGYYT